MAVYWCQAWRPPNLIIIDDIISRDKEGPAGWRQEVDAHTIDTLLRLNLFKLLPRPEVREGWGTSRVTYVREHNGMERMAATITVNNSHS